jgi:hypothetical protein
MEGVIEDQKARIEKQDRALEHMNNERSEALSQLKEARWSLDQQTKRVSKDLQRVRDQCDADLADKDMLISKLRAEAQALLQGELSERAAEHLRLEQEHMERRTVLEMETAHLRDTLAARDSVIEEMRLKVRDYQKRLEEASLNSTKLDTQA